jgi:hypothetical protein
LGSPPGRRGACWKCGVSARPLEGSQSRLVGRKRGFSGVNNPRESCQPRNRLKEMRRRIVADLEGSLVPKVTRLPAASIPPSAHGVDPTSIGSIRPQFANHGAPFGKAAAYRSSSMLVLARPRSPADCVSGEPPCVASWRNNPNQVAQRRTCRKLASRGGCTRQYPNSSQVVSIRA